MSMNPCDIIRKKRFGGELSEMEIRAFVDGVVDGSFADYQASALLMAICINGMTDRETLALTLAMAKSGDTLDTLTLKDFRAISSLFDEDVYEALALKTCVNERKVYGGPAKQSVLKQIELIENFVAERK